MDWIINLIKWFFTEQEVVQPNPETVPEPPKPMTITNREWLYKVAYSCLDVDMAPKQDALGCSESLYYVMKKAGVPNLPKGAIVGTAEMSDWLKKNLKEVETPLAGDIIMSPTGSGNGLIRGHTGIVGNVNIMSNNSKTFLWDDEWNLKRWLKYYTGYGKLSTKYYRWEGERAV